MLCPECNAHRLTGRQELCSTKCRLRRHRRVKAARLARVRELLDRQSAALASGADPAVLAALAREAQRLMERV